MNIDPEAAHSNNNHSDLLESESSEQEIQDKKPEEAKRAAIVSN